VAKRSRGAPGMHELEPGLYKVVVSLGRDSPGRYRQHARTVPAERATSENLEVPLGGLLPSRYARRSQATVRSGSPSLIYLGGMFRPHGPLWHNARRGAGHGLVTVQGSVPHAHRPFATITIGSNAAVCKPAAPLPGGERERRGARRGPG